MWNTQSETVNNVIPALVTATKQFEAIKKTANNPFHKSKYAKLEHIIESINPMLHDNDLAVVQAPFVTDGDSVGIQTVLLHSSGEWIADSGLVITAKAKGKDGVVSATAQTYGSSLTYARRYALASFFNLIQEDDDGNTASGFTKQTPARKPVPANKPAPSKVEPPKTEAMLTSEQLTKISILLTQNNYHEKEIQTRLDEASNLNKETADKWIQRLQQRLEETGNA